MNKLSSHFFTFFIQASSPTTSGNTSETEELSKLRTELEAMKKQLEEEKSNNLVLQEFVDEIKASFGGMDEGEGNIEGAAPWDQ